MNMHHPAKDPKVRLERLTRLEATHDLLQRVRAEHARAFDEAMKACSLAEVATVLGLTRSGVAHYRRALRSGRQLRRAPEGRPTTTREA